MRVRINRAKQLLAETSFPVELISEKIGFERAEYLSRIFKKKVGITPLHFRKHGKAAAVADQLPKTASTVSAI